MAYLGTQPNNVKQNIGLYTSSQILQLTKDGSWSGSLELIQEQTISSSTATMSFTSLLDYNVHLLVYSNAFTLTTDETNMRVRLSNDGGSSYVSSGYKTTNTLRRVGNTLDQNSTSATGIFTNQFRDGNTTGHGYMYFYDLLDSSKMSFVSYQVIGDRDTVWSQVGGAVLPTAETHNAIQISDNADKNFGTLNAKLYGVKEI
jgi:hypothetical protein